MGIIFFRKALVLSAVSSILFCAQPFSQSLPDSTIQKIDSLFKNWDKANSPGCSIGIIRNDSLLFAKGYGMANLEYAVPISPETIFYMASVSKQFTAYCIVLLAKQGKINLEEDVHTYLPGLPDFGKKITVRNLLNHTSGLRDDINLAAFTGLDADGMLTQEYALNIIKKQRTLNFDPGNQYSYSNTNFVLLAEMVKTVSKKSFRSFADSAIFQPLGMKRTRFQDDYTDLIPNRAASYDRVDSNHFMNNFQNVYTLGDGGLFTNMTDMSKWVSNFYRPKVGDASAITQLTQNGKLKNGNPIEYAFGIISDAYKGWKMYTHTGGLAGYRTMVCVFPDLKMGFVVFSNLGDFNVNKILEVAGLFIQDTTGVKAPVKPGMKDSTLAILRDTAAIKNYMGDYLSDEGAQFTYTLKNGKVYWQPYGRNYLLVQAEKDTFFMFEEPEVKFVFSKGPGKALQVDQYWPGNHRLLVKYVTATTLPDQVLQKYTGTYYSAELDCKYTILLKNHHLFLSSDRHDNASLTMAGQNDLISQYWWMNHLKMLRTGKDEINGFEVDEYGVMHLRFNKMK